MAMTTVRVAPEEAFRSDDDMGEKVEHCVEVELLEQELEQNTFVLVCDDC